MSAFLFFFSFVPGLSSWSSTICWKGSSSSTELLLCLVDCRLCTFVWLCFWAVVPLRCSACLSLGHDLAVFILLLFDASWNQTDSSHANILLKNHFSYSGFFGFTLHILEYSYLNLQKKKILQEFRKECCQTYILTWEKFMFLLCWVFLTINTVCLGFFRCSLIAFFSILLRVFSIQVLYVLCEIDNIYISIFWVLVNGIIFLIPVSTSSEYTEYQLTFTCLSYSFSVLLPNSFVSSRSFL